MVDRRWRVPTSMVSGVWTVASSSLFYFSSITLIIFQNILISRLTFRERNNLIRIVKVSFILAQRDWNKL